MKKAIMIVGMPKNGISVLAGLLEKLGVDLGTEPIGSASSNEKHRFENLEVSKLNEKILFENDLLYDDIKYELLIPDDSQETYILEAKKILEDEFSYSKIFAIKDPRLCITFPIWEKALIEFGAEIEIILPWRNPFEVAKSLKARDSFSIEKSLLLWAKYFFLAEYQSRKYKRIFINFATLVSETENSIRDLQDFIGFGGSIDPEALTFIEKDLKHQNISLQNVDDTIPNFLKKIIELMVKNELNEENEDIFNSCREEYLSSMKIFYANDIVPNLKSYKNVEVENALKEQETLLKESKQSKNEALENLQALKTEHEKELQSKNEALENLQNSIKEKEESLMTLKKELLEDVLLLKKSKQALKTEHEKELQSKNEALENLQNSIKEKDESLISHSEEIANLKFQIDEVVEDLVSIKESKCWIYTKPLRDLQKVIRRDDV